MSIELCTMVMIENPATDEVLVQNRTGRWPGWSFPGGKVDPHESFHDCAVREVKEETGLDITNLTFSGIVHWCDKKTSDRYVVFLYKTKKYSGTLIPEFDKGQNFWHDKDAIKKAEPNKFSNERVQYIKLYLMEEFSEAFIPWTEGDDDCDIFYK